MKKLLLGFSLVLSVTAFAKEEFSTVTCQISKGDDLLETILENPRVLPLGKELFYHNGGRFKVESSSQKIIGISRHSEIENSFIKYEQNENEDKTFQYVSLTSQTEVDAYQLECESNKTDSINCTMSSRSSQYGDFEKVFTKSYTDIIGDSSSSYLHPESQIRIYVSYNKGKITSLSIKGASLELHDSTVTLSGQETIDCQLQLDKNKSDFKKVKKILKKRCTSCHDSVLKPWYPKIKMKEYKVVFHKRKEILSKVQGKLMPPRDSSQAAKMTQAERNEVVEWIKYGTHK